MWQWPDIALLGGWTFRVERVQGSGDLCYRLSSTKNYRLNAGQFIGPQFSHLINEKGLDESLPTWLFWRLWILATSAKQSQDLVLSIFCEIGYSKDRSPGSIPWQVHALSLYEVHAHKKGKCISYYKATANPQMNTDCPNWLQPLHSSFWGSWTQFLHVCFGVVGGAPTQQQAILRHQQGIREFNSILMLSTQRQHQTPQVKGSVLQDATHLHPQLQMPTESPGCHLYFWPTGYKSAVPFTPFSGLIIC